MSTGGLRVGQARTGQLAPGTHPCSISSSCLPPPLWVLPPRDPTGSLAISRVLPVLVLCVSRARQKHKSHSTEGVSWLVGLKSPHAITRGLQVLLDPGSQTGPQESAFLQLVALPSSALAPLSGHPPEGGKKVPTARASVVPATPARWATEASLVHLCPRLTQSAWPRDGRRDQGWLWVLRAHPSFPLPHLCPLVMWVCWPLRAVGEIGVMKEGHRAGEIQGFQGSGRAGLCIFLCQLSVPQQIGRSANIRLSLLCL